MNNNNSEEKVWWTVSKVIVIVLILVISVISAYVLQFHEHKLATSTAMWGSFGDYFAGIINGILAPVTIVLIWLTYDSQKDEAKQQRKIIVSQMELMSQQSFEQTFFSWLQSIQDIPPAGKIDLAAQVYTHQINQQITQYLNYCMVNIADENYEGIKSTMAEQINSSYGGNYKKIVIEGKDFLWIDTYSYALLEFLRFIHINKIYPDTEEKKRQYVSILISHLNDGARILLGAFTISKNDKASLELLRHYHFFSRMTGQESIDRLLTRFSTIELS